MVAYQNCAQSLPEEAINASSGSPSSNSAFSSITGVSHQGSERVYAVAQGGDLNLYTAGYSMTAPPDTTTMQGLVTKLGPSGQLVWSKVYGGPQNASDQFFSMIIDSDGHLVVAGVTRSFLVNQAETDGILMKINKDDGSIIWTRTYRTAGSDEFHSVKAMPSGGYVISGKTSTTAAAAEDALVMRVDSTGAVVWSRTMGGAQADRFTDVLVTSEGGLVKIIAGGFTQSYGATSAGVAQREGMMAKFSDAGVVEWQRIYGGTVEDRITGIIETADKANYIVAMKADVAATDGSDTVIAKLNLDGTLVSAHSLGMNFFDEAYDIIRAKDNSFVVASMTSNAVDIAAPNSDFNIRLTNVAANLGSILWNRVYGRANEEQGFFSGVVQRADGGYAVGATTKSYGAGTEDALLIQTDELGRVNSAVTCSEVQSPAQTITVTPITNAVFTPSVNGAIAMTRTNQTTATVADLAVTQINACVP